jgi:predicted ester cyclase
MQVERYPQLFQRRPERLEPVLIEVQIARAGAENLAGLLGSFLGALPDLYAAEQDITAENDLVMVRFVVTATVKGSLLGVSADGKPVRWNAVDIYRVTDGKISEEWAADDIATIMAQLGVFSPPWAA